MAYAQCIDGHNEHVYDQSPRYIQVGQTYCSSHCDGVLTIEFFEAQGPLPAPPAAPRLAGLGSTLVAVGAMRPAHARLVHLAATPAQQASDAIPKIPQAWPDLTLKADLRSRR